MSGAVWLCFDSAGPGGVETHLAALAPALRRAGVAAEVVFLADHGPHPLRGLLDAADAPWRALVGGLRGFAAAVARERPALLHSHGYKAALHARALRLAGGPPVVSTMHSGGFGRGRVGVYNRLDHLTTKLSRLIAVSPALAARYPGAALIENGIDLPPDPPPPGAAVAFAGRLSEEKGPVVFARLAAARPMETRAAEPWLVFGDGPLRAEAEAAASGAAQFRGAVASMAAHWSEVGLLVMPSRFEGLPMAALEAMARGRPVAAYAVGGLPGLLAEGRGFLAPCGDEAALAAAVARWRALSPEARSALGGACRTHVAARHGMQACAQGAIAVYEAALRRPLRPVPAS
jgi:glycosyltransferase involved in cell wall biosynthesis